MPRKKEPPRLWERKRTDGKNLWVILDGGKQIATGCTSDDREGAEEQLRLYLDRKWSSVQGSHNPDSLTVGQVLAIYVKERGPEVSSKSTLSYCVEALAPFWAVKKVSEVKGNVCRRYRAERNQKGCKDSTVRRELGVMEAALNHCHTEGYLMAAPKVWLPPAPPPRDRVLSPAEVDQLLEASRMTPHLYRFIWLGVHTGTRSDAMLRLQWQPNTEGGHIDLEAGLLYRKSAMQKETKKRQTAARLHPDMIEQIASWRECCRQYVIEWRGAPVRSVKTGFRKACSRAGVEGASPHVLRHTAITQAITNGAASSEVSSFFGITLAELERTYLHHHPDHQKSVGNAIMRGRNVAGNVAEIGDNPKVTVLKR